MTIGLPVYPNPGSNISTDRIFPLLAIVHVGAAVQSVPPFVMFIAVTAPPSTIAVAVAPLPVFPENAIVGADVYPLPPLFIVIALINPEAATVQVATALLPPPPVIVTNGGDLYPLPLFVNVILLTLPAAFTTVVPVVVVPPIGAVVNVITGGLPCKYPVPAVVIVTPVILLLRE